MEAQSLKSLAKNSGYRYTYLASKLNVSKSTFSKYLNGDIMIPDEKKRVLLSIISK
jgi:transcriptional regulator with XRE-family HTH domain